MNLLSKEQIKRNLALFENGSKNANDDGRKSWARYASFDYCFNYFQSFKDKNKIADKTNIQNSCLHLAFYLASWGMLRGSSFLLQKSIKFYEPLIEYISKQDDVFWKIDINNYSDENIEKIVKCVDDIKLKLSCDGKYKVSDTLVTKIMLGIFGNVPAFDSYFKIGSGLNTLNKHSLKEIKSFYDKTDYLEIISAEADRIKTFDYDSGAVGNRSYTEAKVIDMIFFMEGYNRLDSNEK